MLYNVQFVLADSQHGSILSLDDREAFVAAASTHVGTRTNWLDLVHPRISQDVKKSETEFVFDI